MKSIVRMLFVMMLAVLCTSAQADVKLPAIFSDHMAVQSGALLPVWGSATPGERITVSLDGQTKSSIADETGRWRLTLDPIASGKALMMSVRGTANTITVSDVISGEVWLCAGQSNMAWPVRSALDDKRETANAEFPQIRLFKVTKRASEQPLDDVSGRWVVCSPQTVSEFSAVAYFFGRELHRAVKAPVGLIDSSWGGTPGDAWVDPQSLLREPLTKPIIDRYEASRPQFADARKQYEIKLAEYRAAVYLKDVGPAAATNGWERTDFDDRLWKQATQPERWEVFTGADTDGAVWFRKEFEAPAAWVGKELLLSLGAIDDFDVTWFNGKRVGESGQVQQSSRQLRAYVIAGSLVKAGRNVIAIRVFDQQGAGGLVGPPEAMSIGPRQGVEPRASLAAEWKYEVELSVPRRVTNIAMPMEPAGPNTPSAPGNVYNAMIHPLAPFAIKGFAWYHGEQNVGRGYQYRGILSALIDNWRRDWAQPDATFLITQLANFRAPAESGHPSEWAELRESQFLITRTTPKCALAVTIDLGDAGDIHPRNKQDVGRRLALAAQRTAYGKEVFCNGPIYKSMRVEQNRIVVNFEASLCGLAARGGVVRGFAIAGEDRKFVPADAEIAGQVVVVSSPAVTHPVAVRYAWGDNPPATLYNSEGLPAIPFRTDDWPGVTFERR